MLLVGRELDYVEFMAVRKIPMKEQPRFAACESPTSQDGGMDVDSEDPEVLAVTAKIRERVLTDRALHDKVFDVFALGDQSLILTPCTGCKGFRFLCACILETRGVLYLPSEGPRPRGAREELRAPSPAPHARTQGRREERLGGCGRKCKPFALQLPHGAA